MMRTSRFSRAPRLRTMTGPLARPCPGLLRAHFAAVQGRPDGQRHLAQSAALPEPTLPRWFVCSLAIFGQLEGRHERHEESSFEPWPPERRLGARDVRAKAGSWRRPGYPVVCLRCVCLAGAGLRAGPAFSLGAVVGGGRGGGGAAVVRGPGGGGGGGGRRPRPARVRGADF